MGLHFSVRACRKPSSLVLRKTVVRLSRPPDPELTDDALLAAMAVGDEAAGVAFVRRYQRRVYGLALSMVGDPALAEDVSQEAFLRVWRHAAVFDRRRAAPATWVLTITRNLAVDALRVRRPVPAGPGEAVLAYLVDGAARPEQRAEGSDMRTRLVGALGSLPPEQARAVVLAVVYGYTAEEVARLDKIPLGTAKTRIRRGLQRLRAASAPFLTDGTGKEVGR
jgi:RNA polymerase sigma-70 factor (ECF subfamily)